jgi:hypothetical protein
LLFPARIFMCCVCPAGNLQRPPDMQARGKYQPVMRL